MAHNAFDWFTGVAAIATECPPALREPGALERFYAGPNAPEWGTALPRLLMHETLHAWQLAGSRWLQRMVDEEWQRALALQPGQLPQQMGPLRHAFGRAPAGASFSVRDIAECLARFWDVHIRGPHTLLAEEGDELGGRLAAIDALREREGHGGYSWMEFEALMTEGREHAAYAAAYRWLLEQARAAAAVRGAQDAPPGMAESWAANVVLPIAGFAALNADEPVPAFRAAVARLLQPDAISVAATRRHPAYRSINLDWLIVWPVLMPGVVRVLRRQGLWVVPPAAEPQLLATHPVWRHLPARHKALQDSLWRVPLAAARVKAPTSPEEAALHLEAQVYPADPWALFGMPGQPTARYLLGTSMAPPLLRFADGELLVHGADSERPAWPDSAQELQDALRLSQGRMDSLQRADAAARFGLPPGAFAGAA